MVDQARLENSAHLDAMRKFARGNETAEASAVEIYERERYALSERARVERFVGILAEKRAKAVILKLKGARIRSR
jgi:hypothetical protein